MNKSKFHPGERIRLNHIGTELPADIKQLLYKYTQMEFGK